jgi:aspartyl aminopeptidase
MQVNEQVAMIDRWLTMGHSVATITDQLNEQGYQCLRNNGRWDEKIVLDIIQNFQLSPAPQAPEKPHLIPDRPI